MAAHRVYVTQQHDLAHAMAYYANGVAGLVNEDAVEAASAHLIA